MLKGAKFIPGFDDLDSSKPGKRDCTQGKRSEDTFQ